MTCGSATFASHCSLDHACFKSSLASQSKVADMGNHCTERCACEALCCREEKHVIGRSSVLRFLTQASLLDGSLCRSLCSVVCTSETAPFVRVLPHFFTSYFFRVTFFGVFFFFPHFRVFTDFFGWEGPRDHETSLWSVAFESHRLAVPGASAASKRADLKSPRTRCLRCRVFFYLQSAGGFCANTLCWLSANSRREKEMKSVGVGQTSDEKFFL